MPATRKSGSKSKHIDDVALLLSQVVNADVSRRQADELIDEISQLLWAVSSLDPDAIAEHVRKYEGRFLSPFVAAERGYVDEVIEPSQTRLRVARALAMLRHKEAERPWKKHDNIPV